MEQQEQRNGWNPEEDPRYRDIRGSVGGQGMYNPEEMQRQRLASSAMVLGIAAILFFISDAILVNGLFAGSYSVVGSAFNLLTYYYAQYIIALSAGLSDRKD